LLQLAQLGSKVPLPLGVTKADKDRTHTQANGGDSLESDSEFDYEVCVLLFPNLVTLILSYRKEKSKQMGQTSFRIDFQQERLLHCKHSDMFPQYVRSTKRLWVAKLVEEGSYSMRRASFIFFCECKVASVQPIAILFASYSYTQHAKLLALSSFL
jgi:hypothetical protein